MSIDWPAFLSLAFVTTFTPGPNNIAAASSGVAVGYRRSLPFIFGVGSGFALVMLLCATAASLLLQWVPAAAPVLRVAGAAYVLWLAWRTWRSGYDLAAADQPTLGFRNGFVLQFLNLKMIVYGLTVFASFLAPFAGRVPLLVLSAIGMAGIALSSTTTWATAGSWIGRHLHRPRLRVALNGGLALLLVWTAVALLRADVRLAGAQDGAAGSSQIVRAAKLETRGGLVDRELERTVEPAVQPADEPALRSASHSASPAQSTAQQPASPYVWPKGPPADPAYFPIGVWLQSPSNAAAFRALGINHFIGLWQGPTDEQLDALGAAGMPVFASQNAVGRARLGDETLLGWTQQDEPDNAQSDGQGGYGPCIEPAEIIRRYEAMKAADPDRPVWLNLGQGVAWDEDRPYVGRGSACANRWDHYPEYIKGADIVSFDIYPVTSRYEHIQGDLTRVALGIDRLREWSGGEKIVWNVIETTHINSQVMPSPAQTRAEVWLSLVHGSMGIVYFVHEWVPRFREPALLDYPEMMAAVKRVNGEIEQLAPVLNSPTLDDVVTVTPTDPNARIDVMTKQHEGWLYLFAVAPKDEPAAVVLRPDPALIGAGDPPIVEVLGEDRSILMEDGAIQDRFDGYGVHLYRVRSVASAGPTATAIARSTAVATATAEATATASGPAPTQPVPTQARPTTTVPDASAIYLPRVLR